MDFAEYPKIYGPFERDTTPGPNRNRIIPGRWSRPEFETLAELPWVWTEKVDGTNVRVGWDGHKVTFGGRTDNAQMPMTLLTHLQSVFTEELFEQAHGETAVTLYGEGFGAGIQKGGGRYSPTPSFVLFDVRIGGFWLLRTSVIEVAEKLGIPYVPEPLTGRPKVLRAIDAVRFGLASYWGDGFEAEGIVGTPSAGFLDRAGRRIMMKIKSADYGPDAPLWTP